MKSQKQKNNAKNSPSIHSSEHPVQERDDDDAFEVTFGLFTFRPTPPKKRIPNRGGNFHRSTSHPSIDRAAVAALRAELPPDVLRRIEATGELADDVFLAKWIKTRGADAAAQMIEAHANWRETFVGTIDGQTKITESSIAAELEAKKIFLQGIDVNGSPVLLFISRRHTAGVHPAEDTLRLLVYAIDAACAAAANPDRKICCIFDLSNVKLRNLDINFLRGMFGLFQSHFPETLQKLYFLDAPTLFWGVWRCVVPFINPNTRSKIVFLSKEEGQRQLVQEIGGSSILPKDIGGSAVSGYIPIEEAVAMMRQGRKLPSAVAAALLDGGGATTVSSSYSEPDGSVSSSKYKYTFSRNNRKSVSNLFLSGRRSVKVVLPLLLFFVLQVWLLSVLVSKKFGSSSKAFV